VGAHLSAFYFHSLAHSPILLEKVIARTPFDPGEACNRRPWVGLPDYKVLVLYNVLVTADGADLQSVHDTTYVEERLPPGCW